MDLSLKNISLIKRGGKLIDYNEWAKKIYGQNCDVGWWDDADRCMFQTLQLVSTEVAEATEGERKDLMDDKLTHRKMGEVELADTMIRVLDIGGRMGFIYDLSYEYPLSYFNGESIGAKHLTINKYLISFAAEFNLDDKANYPAMEVYYAQLVSCIADVCKKLDYDLEGAMIEKHEFNKQREDHKRENREKEHGKKF